MSFDPKVCRNESEVESKLIVQYLLPALGYAPSNWHQEVALGSIRLDFLALTSQVFPSAVDLTPKICVVIEAKHPKHNLNNHVRRLSRYLRSLRVTYGVLTNAKDFRIYELVGDAVTLNFQCKGLDISDKLEIIKDIISRDKLADVQIPSSDPSIVPEKISEKIPQIINLKPKENLMKTIAVYHNKGGVGKTTTVVNLAAAISRKGKRVLVIDLDSQANTTFATGLVKFDDEEFDDIEKSNILHVIESEDFFSISEVAIKSDFCNPPIHVIPAHINLMNAENELNQLDYSRMILVQKLKDVENEYDVVIIDTPPSLNLYARIALIACDFLIIPSDLQPFANQGLINVKDFVKKVNGFRKQINKNPINVLGVLPNKISSNARFVQYSLPKRLKKIPDKYELDLMESVIYDRQDLAKCAEMTQLVGNLEIADPKSIFEFKPDSMAAQEFELLAIEILEKIGL